MQNDKFETISLMLFNNYKRKNKLFNFKLIFNAFKFHALNQNKITMCQGLSKINSVFRKVFKDRRNLILFKALSIQKLLNLSNASVIIDVLASFKNVDTTNFQELFVQNNQLNKVVFSFLAK